MQASVRIRFGDRVREYRLARGWTQEVLSEKSKTSPEQISHIENAKREPGLCLIEKLALGFGLSISELMKNL